MFQRLLHARFTIWGILIMMLLIVLPLNGVIGQGATAVEVGTATVGTITADNTPLTYSFNGNAGDVITIRAVGLTAGTDPNITLFDPAQQQLAFNDNETFMSSTTSSEITFRLQSTGTHFVMVSG